MAHGHRGPRVRCPGAGPTGRPVRRERALTWDNLEMFYPPYQRKHRAILDFLIKYKP